MTDLEIARPAARRSSRVINHPLMRLALIALPALAVLVVPAPADLPVRAQRVLAVVVLATSPLLVVVVLLVVAAMLRAFIPNITGFLATTIPLAMSVGTAIGVNPLVCGRTRRGRRGGLGPAQGWGCRDGR